MHRTPFVASLAAALLLTAVSASAGPPPPMRWSFTAPSALSNTANGEDWFYGVVPLADGGYLAVGYTELLGQNNISAVVAPVSAAGVLGPEVTFSGPNGAVLFDVTETPTGYVAVGAAGGAVLVAGIGKNLQTPVVTWQTFTAATLTPLTPTEALEAHSVRPVPAGGVIVAGWRGPWTNPTGALLLRLDNNLAPISSFGSIMTGATVVDAAIKARAQSVRVESSLGQDFAILAGSAQPGTDTDIYVAKVDANTGANIGPKLWSRTLSKAQLVALGYVETIRVPVCGSVAQTLVEEADTAEPIPISAGGGYMVAVQVNLLAVWNPLAYSQYSPCSNPVIPPTLSYIDLDAGLVRLDSAGTPLWAKQIGRFSGIDFRTPLLLHDGGVIVVGNDAHTDSTHVKVSAIKTDFSGTQVWQGTYIIGGDTNNCVFGVAAAPDGSIVVAGNNTRPGTDDDYVLMKIGPARDLWMRDDVTDIGDEPYQPSGPLWASPELWVRNFQDFYPWPNAHLHENPEYRLPAVLVPNYVYTEVRNRGVEPASGVVHFYYAKASTGLTWPSSWTGSTDCCPLTPGAKCSGELPSATITNLLPNATQIVSIPWYPPNPTDFAACGPPLEQGHYCLLARIETSPSSPTLGLAFMEGSDVNANTGANNNIVWKNVTVVDNFPGAGKPRDSFALIHNVVREPAAVTLAFTVPRGELREPVFNVAEIEILLAPAVMQRWIAGGRKAKGVTLSEGVLRITETRAELQNILLEADQQDWFGIRLIPRKSPRLPTRGSASLDVAQIQGLKTVGGVRFTVRTKVDVKGPQPGQIDPRDPLRRPAWPNYPTRQPAQPATW